MSVPNQIEAFEMNNHFNINTERTSDIIEENI